MLLTKKFWTPIGTKDNPFNGRFDFKDHAISGIYLAYTFEPLNHGGLFGVLGEQAIILSSSASIWYVYPIVAIAVLMVALLVVTILIARKRGKRREALSKI